MGKFDIVGGPEKIDIALPPLQANLSASFTDMGGGVGSVLGQAAVALTGAVSKGLQKRQKEKKVQREKLEKIAEVKQKRLDTISSVAANKLVQTAIDEHKAFRIENADTTIWEDDLRQRLTAVGAEIDGIDMSPEARALLNEQLLAKGGAAFGDSFIAETQREVEDTKAAVIDDVTGAYTDGTAEDQRNAGIRFLEVAGTLWDEAEAKKVLKTAVMAGQKARADNLSNDVYAAIEANQFDVAKQLATNPTIPESKQATLRTAIETAENKLIAEERRLRQELINKTTSDTLRESYQGTLTVAELDKRHETGLIKDDKFESMRKALEVGIPETSDPFVRSEMSNAVTQFKAGQIDKEAVQTIYLNSLPNLDQTDRDKFDNDIATVSIKIIETGMANAKRAGAELISPQFKTAKGEILLPDFTGEKAEQERADAERKLNLEIRLRNLYYDALDEWKESQKDKDVTSRDIRRVENSLLIEFRKIKNVELDKLEAGIEVVEKQQLQPLPIKESKSLRELNIEQLKARREKLRKQLK